MIQLYLLDCSYLADPQNLAYALPLLDEQRREKTLKFKPPMRRAQSAGAGLLLKHLFGDAIYTYGANGKPYLKDRNDLFFSISHSDHYVVCTASETEVGVDIEPLSPIRPAMVRRCFSADEQNWIGDDAHRFTRLWTMKEAYMKFTGTGLSVPAKDIHLPIPPDNGFDPGNSCWWHLCEWDAPISLCSSEKHAVEVRNITIKDLL